MSKLNYKDYIKALILFIFIINASCKKGPASTADIEESSKYPAIQIVKDSASGLTAPNYDILSSKITKDILTITVKYGGGCRQHKFELRSNGQPSASVFELHLLHLTTDDHCRRLLLDTLQFDLSPLRKISEKYSVKISPYPQIIYPD
ncbi:hypothetical protein MYP_2559 [Sporocytophaga myxococcoides]|uniref:Uncharacterized protein n=1 Tax=Sporocytophaga myxococcoides TaxID=153721 RepID=A0A098LEJ0_9BACT|nr:hypothetical protein [Sporocytophaga myxococcoides]GAL85330.1 hypothetical protein MYP_2559 [Sporocytophaga myxococcoides]